METTDTRKLSQDAQEEIRRQAIRGLRAGKKQVDLARDLGVHQPTISGW